MTQTIQEKLYDIEDNLFEEFLRFQREKEEEENYLAYAKRLALSKSVNRLKLMSVCKDYCIEVTDCMSNDEMSNALLNLPHGTRSKFGFVFEDEEKQKEEEKKLDFAEALLNDISIYLKYGGEDEEKGKLLLHLYEDYLYMFS